jgi:hypothetical protein
MEKRSASYLFFAFVDIFMPRLVFVECGVVRGIFGGVWDTGV